MTPRLLSVKDLAVSFHTSQGIAKAVNKISFDIQAGETLGIVGESGCGKSVTSLAIMGLLASPPAKLEGSITFQNEELLGKTDEEMCKIRGKEISMIFQEPMTALNPVFTVGEQLIETIVLHQHLNKREAREKAVEMLRLVSIPLPETRLKQYPHQLSGGMRQRVMIAMALSCNPKLLIADEPTTALDVSVQAQILELMKDIKQRLGTAIIMITHDLGVIAEVADRVMVMYAGNVVEFTDVNTLFEKPLHPYTQGLMASLPSLELERDKLSAIPGTVPSLYDLPKGCKFCTRCGVKSVKCEQDEPELTVVGNTKVKCWHVNGGTGNEL